MDSVLYLLAYLFNDKTLINEKTISIRVFGFVLTCSERSHRKLSSRNTPGIQSVQCICSVCYLF